MKFTLSSFLFLILASFIHQAFSDGYDLGGEDPICWKTVSGGSAVQLDSCPYGLNVEFLTDPNTLDMREGVHYNLPFTAYINQTTTKVNGNDSPHLNVHSCLSSVGFCSPFIANTPGLSTHSAEEWCNLTMAGPNDYECTVQNDVILEKEIYTIIAHARFFIGTTKYDIAQAALSVEVKDALQEIKLEDGVKAGMITYSFVGVAILLAVSERLYHYRKTSVAKLAQVDLLGMMTVSGIVAIIGGAFTLSEATEASCYLRPWVVVMPMVFSFSLLMARTMRAAKVLEATKTLKRITITWKEVFYHMMITMCPFVIIFIIQAGVDPPQPTREYSETNDSEYQVVCATDNEVAWNVLLVVLFIIYMGIACYYARISSQMITLLNEGAHLAFGIYSMTLFSVIAMVAAVITSTEPSLIYFTSMFCITTGVVIMILALVWPKRKFVEETKNDVMSVLSVDDEEDDEDDGAVTVDTIKMDDGEYLANKTISAILQVHEATAAFVEHYQTLGKVKREDYEEVIRAYDAVDEPIHFAPSASKAVRLKVSKNSKSKSSPTSDEEYGGIEMKN